MSPPYTVVSSRRGIAAGLLGSTAALAALGAADARVLGLLLNTAYLACGSCLLAVPLGIVLACLLVRSDLPGRRGVGVLLLLLLFLPLYLQAAGWDAGFGRQGWFSLSRGTLANPLLGGWRAAIWIHAMAVLPWATLLTGLGLRYSEIEYEEAALLEASALAVFWRVTLRRIGPAAGVATLWGILSVAAEMTVTDLYQVRTLAEQVYLEVRLGGESIPWAAIWLSVGALTLCGFAVVSSLAPAGDQRLHRDDTVFRLRGFRVPAALAVWGVVMLVVGVPLLNLIANAGMQVRAVEGHPQRSWELLKFVGIVAGTPWRFAEEFGWTLLLGGTAASCTVALAVPLAWWACRRRAGALLALSASAVGLAVPAPIVGVSIIWLLNRDSDFSIWLYDRTIFAPVLALVIRAGPLVTLINWYAFRSVDRDALELAATEGAGATRRFTAIGVAQRWSAVWVGWLAAAAIAMGDLSATILVAPPGVHPVSLRVFGLLHAGVDDQVAGLCLTVAGLYLLLGCLAIAGWSRVRSGSQAAGYNAGVR